MGTKKAIKGTKLVYLYRVESSAATADAKGIAFTTENERTKSKDAEITPTKDGSIVTPGTPEGEVTVTAYLAQGDPHISELEQALDNDELMEIWEANLAEPESAETSNKFKAKYFQGYITEMSFSSNSEDYVEVSMTFGLNGKGADGFATVTAEQQELATYAFKDTQKTGTGETGA